MIVIRFLWALGARRKWVVAVTALIVGAVAFFSYWPNQRNILNQYQLIGEIVDLSPSFKNNFPVENLAGVSLHLNLNSPDFDSKWIFELTHLGFEPGVARQIVSSRIPFGMFNDSSSEHPYWLIAVPAEVKDMNPILKSYQLAISDLWNDGINMVLPLVDADSQEVKEEYESLGPKRKNGDFAREIGDYNQREVLHSKLAFYAELKRKVANNLIVVEPNLLRCRLIAHNKVIIIPRQFAVVFGLFAGGVLGGLLLLLHWLWSPDFMGGPGLSLLIPGAKVLMERPLTLSEWLEAMVRNHLKPERGQCLWVVDFREGEVSSLATSFSQPPPHGLIVREWPFIIMDRKSLTGSPGARRLIEDAGVFPSFKDCEKESLEMVDRRLQTFLAQKGLEAGCDLILTGSSPSDFSHLLSCHVPHQVILLFDRKNLEQLSWMRKQMREFRGIAGFPVFCYQLIS